MRRHVIGVRRSRRDLGVGAGRAQTFLGQHGIVVAVNDVVCYTRMLWLAREDRLEDLATLALVGKSLVSLRRSDGQGERMENCRLAVIGISSLHLTHLLLEGLRVRIDIFSILAVNFRESFDVNLFPRSGLGVLLRD